MSARGVSRRFTLVAPEPSEHELQITCADACWRILLPDVQWTAVDLAHSLDERPIRNARPGRDGRIPTIGLIEAQKRKRRGCKPGVWDFLFWHQTNAFALELKVGDGDLSDDQKEFGRGLIRAGCKLKVCWTFEQFIQTITAWGLVRPGVRIAA
jgi:hypothetical protein